MHAAAAAVPFPIHVSVCRAGGRVPVRATRDAAALDLFAAEERGLMPGDKFVPVATGITIAIPPGYYGQVASRSGLALRDKITAFPGVIDADYRGEVLVLLSNDGTAPRRIEPGDRIAQLLILPCWMGAVVAAKADDTAGIITAKADDSRAASAVAASVRGTGGFGSTGMK